MVHLLDLKIILQRLLNTAHIVPEIQFKLGDRQLALHPDFVHFQVA
jgi:hypothetical protein